MKTLLKKMIYIVTGNHLMFPIAFIIYVVFFFILSISGIWENTPEATHDPLPPLTIRQKIKRSAIKTFYNFTIILYLPLLLPFSVLGTFGEVLYSIIRNHTNEFIRNMFKFLLSPFMAFSIIGKKFDKSHMENWFLRIKKACINFVKNKKKDKSVKSKLKIYQQYTKNLTNIDGSFIRDYYFEHTYKFLALLLQIVSFFTTYAGVELFFGNLFDLAPFFITLVIQFGLYSTSITIMKPGKKNPKKKLIMGILASVSMVFSYVGLVTLACPPEHDYQKSYQAYESAFEDAQKHLLGRFQDTGLAAQSIQNEFLKLTDTLRKLDGQLETIQAEIADMDAGIPDRNQSSTTRSYDANGLPVVTTTQTTNPDYTDYIASRLPLTQQQTDITQERERLLAAIRDITGITTHNADGSLSSKLYTELNNYFSANRIQQKLDDPSASGELKQYKHLAITNNETLDHLGLSGDHKINPEIVEDCMAQIELHKAVSAITMPEWQNINPSSSDTLTTVKKILIGFGELFGADLNNSDMKKLLDLWQSVQTYTTQNHLELSPYLSYITDPDLVENLERSLTVIAETPNILLIAFHRFNESGTNSSNALICALLALFNDGATMLLGWAGTRKAYSFLYVKSSKDYYDDIDELFGVIFKSLMQGFCISIRSGDFSDMDIDTFTQACIQQVNATARKIQSFLECFELSECTTATGYNLKFEYLSPDDIKDYLPIISVLIKTNLLKVMPLQQYRHLELEYYCAVNLPLWLRDEDGNHPITDYNNELAEAKTKGNVLLLRNKGENYLRENMCIEIQGEEDAV